MDQILSKLLSQAFCQTPGAQVFVKQLVCSLHLINGKNMDTTAAAELGLGMGTGGGVDGIGYWGPGGTDQEAWATEEEEEFDEAAQLQPDGAWSGGGEPLDYSQQRARYNGEPPLKKTKHSHGEFQANHHHNQVGALCVGGSDYNQGQLHDAFHTGTAPTNINQDGSNSRSASGTSGQRNHNAYQAELGQAASSGSPPAPSAEGSSGAKSKGIGRMFFKTKLCCKFRVGTCPYDSTCNFAHGMEELRKPPPNWQELVAQQDEDRSQRSERRGENQIPSLSSGNGASGDSQRFHKTRACKKYYSEEGCPYGDRCNFLHDEQGRSRESLAINLGPTCSTGSGNELVNGGSGNNNGGSGSFQKPMYWKTRICNKWETTGLCPFGDKCHFAHGAAELQKYGGGLLDLESGATSSGLPKDFKLNGTSSKSHMDPVIGPPYSLYNTDSYIMGIPNQRSITNCQGQRQGQRTLPKWKGPDKISQIYGDWIDDNEWEHTNQSTVLQTKEVSQIHEESSHDVRTQKDEKCYNITQGEQNVPFFKGCSGQNNSQNRLSGTFRSGGKGRDMASRGGSLGVYEDDVWVGEL
eukprot:Gb_34650 [translate_table: standard]